MLQSDIYIYGAKGLLCSSYLYVGIYTIGVIQISGQSAYHDSMKYCFCYDNQP